MAADDPLSAVLADLQSRHYPVTLPTGEPVCESDRHAWPCHAHRALAAVEAALEHHQPRQLYGLAVNMHGTPLCGHDEDYDGDAHFEDANGGLWYCRDKPEQKVCITCTDGDDGDLWAEWPCQTHKGITRELTGEAASDG